MIAVPATQNIEETARIDPAFRAGHVKQPGASRQVLRRIRFVGNRAFSDSRLREVIRTRESRWWRFLSSDDTYDPDRLTLDRELLRRFYLNNGYGDFRVVSAVAELMVIRALEVARAVVVAPVQYTLLIWGTMYGYLVFAELPDLWTWVGALIIIATGAYTLHRERLAGRRR